jgi:hypothetical protein
MSGETQIYESQKDTMAKPVASPPNVVEPIRGDSAEPFRQFRV